MDLAGKPPAGWRFYDMFAGTGAVSSAAADQGWIVSANDALRSACQQTKARLTSAEQVPLKNLGGYQKAIELLNGLNPVEGFFYREYTDSGANIERQKRGYFSIENGQRIDAIRSKLKELGQLGEINSDEHTLLLSDLMIAANAVANTAGTYGCFLRNKSEASQVPIQLKCRSLRDKKNPHVVTNKDVFDLKTAEHSVVYLDPPYTKRQYAAYYHILETIAHEDSPTVTGITGLRPWKQNSSVFCYKSKAAHAIKELIAKLSASRILLSYSSEGHVEAEEIIETLRAHGKLKIHEISGFKRYAPNVKSREHASHNPLTEFIFELKKR